MIFSSRRTCLSLQTSLIPLRRVALPGVALYLRAIAASLLFCGGLLPALAQGTHLWTQSRIDEFEKGTPQGVAITSDGHLRQARGLIEQLTTPSTFVWSVVADKNGTAYLGTSSPATVLRVGTDGKAVTLLETKDVSVQVVKIGPDGALYAATLPSGKVYRLRSDAKDKQDETTATVIFDMAKFDSAAKASENQSADSKASEKKSDDGKSSDGKKTTAHYIWDLAFDAAGRLYIATGGPGIIYRLDPSKKDQAPEPFFKSDEAHIRSLAWDAQGNLIAGSDGSGLVYRISPSGRGYVLFEAPRREITAVAVGANGTIYAASVGDKSRNPLPPLPVQSPGNMSFTIVQPGSLQAANSSVSLPEGSEIYALTPSADGLAQAPRKLWSGKDEIVYALSADAEGLLALTGNRGRIFRIADDGSYADVAHLEAQQGLSFATSQTDKKIFIGTGNTGKLVCLCPAESHEYASDVLDAGALARFGRIETAPDSANYELLTRTGNVEQPARGKKDWGWSDWQPLKDGAVASPAGRYLQWKAALKANGTLGSVGVNYLPVNAAPVVDDLVVVPGARVNPQGQQNQAQQPVSITFSAPASSNKSESSDPSANSPLQATKDRTAITVRWAAHDDNGDELTFALYLRGDGEKVWRLLKDEITDKAYSFDATLIPDGGYQVKVVASDAPSHTPGDALSGAKESERFEVDTTPPVIENLKANASGLLTFDAVDAFSPIARAEYSLDAGPWQFIEPVGGLSDSRREHYEIHSLINPLNQDSRELKSANSENLITVRVYDRHENVGVAKTVLGSH